MYLSFISTKTVKKSIKAPKIISSFFLSRLIIKVGPYSVLAFCRLVDAAIDGFADLPLSPAMKSLCTRRYSKNVLMIIIMTRPVDPTVNQLSCMRCLFSMIHRVIQHKVNMRNTTNVTMHVC